MENFELGLVLMAVGMLTVFSILLLVIGLGKGLIFLVNKYAPEEVIVKHTPANTAAANDASSGQTTVAIVSAISAITGAQGKVTKIEKL